MSAGQLAHARVQAVIALGWATDVVANLGTDSPDPQEVKELGTACDQAHERCNELREVLDSARY